MFHANFEYDTVYKLDCLCVYSACGYSVTVDERPFSTF